MKVLRVVAGLLFIVAMTFILERIPVNPTTAGFAYLITILLVAARWGLLESVTASAAAAFCLNYFFLPPVRTLNIADAHNWVALSAFLVTSLVASQLSEVARRRNAQLHQRQTEMERLYALSRGIMLIDSEKPAGVQIAAEIVRIYDVTSVTIYDQTDDQIMVRRNRPRDSHAGYSPRTGRSRRHGGRHVRKLLHGTRHAGRPQHWRGGN